jgi:hypothetical protein
MTRNVPTFEINPDNLHNLIGFIHRHDGLLKEHGAIKIKPNSECKLAFKKCRGKIISCPTPQKLFKVNGNEHIYFVKKVANSCSSVSQNPSITDEDSFWNSLSDSDSRGRYLNISLLSGQSFFNQKGSRANFDIHRLPKQSLLQLGGREVTRQFVPTVGRAHAPGAIFPLTSTPKHLCSINYHHGGGEHHWYIIPQSERENLYKIIARHDSTVCLDHTQLVIDPSVLDKHQIRYYQIIQHPNEFVVFSADALSQRFTKGASWSESIDFALPSWIEATMSCSFIRQCQCHISHDYSFDFTDVSLFGETLVRKYINSLVSNGMLR